MVTFHDIEEAAKRIKPYVFRTPLLRVPALDALAGCEAYIKPENLQYTGSFKIRGATNRILQFTEREKAAGIVSASSGNHAKAVATAARRLGIRVCIIMPENPNPSKLEAIRELGAQVLFEGTLSSQRAAKAKELQKAGQILVHSHADPQVIAGQGTIGLEILEDCPSMDAVVAPIGGGGLISGIATAVKRLSPQTKVIGVEPSGAARYTQSLRAGRAVTLEKTRTIADGTRCDHADENNFEMIRALVDSIALAEEEDIRRAMRQYVQAAKIVAEPSSSLGLAAALAGRLKFSPGDKVCFVVTGGNNDIALLRDILRDGE